MADDLSINRIGIDPNLLSGQDVAAGNEADTFLKKIGPWAFYSFFLSTQNDVEETLGRFSVQPVDAVVMNYLEAKVAPSNRLPTGHLYDTSLSQVMGACGDALQSSVAEEAADALELLDRDAQMRDYLQTRRLEYFLS
jgi:hypothetical protein